MRGASPLGTIAAVALGAGLSPAGALAAEVGPGGALDLTVSGFAAFQAHGGALGEQREDPDLSSGLDFSNDTEVHVILRGRHDATGVEYGGTVELEADTNGAANAGETWVFVRGGFGELRLGDEDGPVDASALGGFTVAAGTGGIDGEVVDEIAVDAVLPTNTDDSTKIRYYTPSLGGLQLGLSYTPNDGDEGDGLAAKDVELGHWVEGAVVYEAEVGEAELQASLVGSLGEVKDGGGGDRLWTYHAGAAAELPPVGLGAGFGREDVGGLERRYANAGVGAELGPVQASLTYGRVLATAGYDGVGEPWNLVVSADAELLDGVVVAGDLAYVENDLDPDDRRAAGGDAGWAWVARLELAF